MRGNIIKERSKSYVFEKTPRICRTCKLVPVHYWKFENGLLSVAKPKALSFASKDSGNPVNEAKLEANLFVRLGGPKRGEKCARNLPFVLVY